MKRLLFILVFAAAAWWLWRERPWENLPSFFAVDRKGWDAPRASREADEKSEAFPPSLRSEFVSAIDDLCAPLDREGTAGRLSALEKRVQNDARQGAIDGSREDRLNRFCARLRRLQAERFRRRVELQRLQSSDMHSLRGAQGDARKREFLVKEYMQSWARHAREQKLLLMRDLPE
jgi:hypothetical protein